MGLFSKTDSLMVIEGDEIVIRTIPRLGKAKANDEKRFHMSKISAINFANPTFKYKGYIQLVVDGYDETTGETSVFFENGSELASENMYKSIEKCVREYHAAHPEECVEMEPPKEKGKSVFKRKVVSLDRPEPDQKADLKDAQSGAAESEIIETIKKYKELLDCGAITQAEYDAKKKQLLGL